VKRVGVRRWRHEPLRRPLALLAGTLAAIAVVLGLAHAGLAFWVERQSGSPAAPPIAAPPVVPGAAPVPVRAPDYRWLDRTAGIAEIPVARAIELLGSGAAQREAPR
jgi:hypothetical protein